MENGNYDTIYEHTFFSWIVKLPTPCSLVWRCWRCFRWAVRTAPPSGKLPVWES